LLTQSEIEDILSKLWVPTFGFLHFGYNFPITISVVSKQQKVLKLKVNDHNQLNLKLELVFIGKTFLIFSRTIFENLVNISHIDFEYVSYKHTFDLKI